MEYLDYGRENHATQFVVLSSNLYEAALSLWYLQKQHAKCSSIITTDTNTIKKFQRIELKIKRGKKHA